VARRPAWSSPARLSRNGRGQHHAQVVPGGTAMAATVAAGRERLDNARGSLAERDERPTLLPAIGRTTDRGIAWRSRAGRSPEHSPAPRRTCPPAESRARGHRERRVVGEPKDEVRIEINPGRTRAWPGRRTSLERVRARTPRRGRKPSGGPIRFAFDPTEFQRRGHRRHAGGRPRAEFGLKAIGRSRSPTRIRRPHSASTGKPAVGLWS